MPSQKVEIGTLVYSMKLFKEVSIIPTNDMAWNKNGIAKASLVTCIYLNSTHPPNSWYKHTFVAKMKEIDHEFLIPGLIHDLAKDKLICPQCVRCLGYDN